MFNNFNNGVSIFNLGNRNFETFNFILFNSIAILNHGECKKYKEDFNNLS